MNETNFQCFECVQWHPIKKDGITTGYATDAAGNKFCYECCAKRDKREMDLNGRICLYLTREENGRGKVTNWPSSLSFGAGWRKGRHNIAGVRYDVWFTHNGFYWHGVTYGDNTQICHCKRTKEKSK